MPGTTRDAIDVNFRIGEMDFTAIDTAGARKRKQVKEPADFYSIARTERSIRRADVVVHMMDAPGEVSRVDKRLADYVVQHYKPCVLAVNKMDLAEGATPAQFEQYVRASLPMISYMPVVCISALDGTNVFSLLETACDLYEQSRIWVGAEDLESALQDIISRKPVPSRSRWPAKIREAKQAAVQPPTIVLYATRSADVDENYRRYLANQLRQALGFSSVPVKLMVRSAGRSRTA